MVKIACVCLLLSTAVLFPAVGDAGINRWTTQGPDGGRVFDLAFSPSAPSVVYAATDGGIFKSTNGGAAWTLCPGLEHFMSKVAVDPTTPTTVYGGASSDGFYKSTDGGATWSFAGSGFSDLRIRGVAVDPHAPATVYVGTQYGGAYKSSDRGDTWTSITGSLPGAVQAFAFDPSMPGVVYAGLETGDVYKSIDDGATWLGAATGLGSSSVNGLVVDPYAPATLYAATFSGIYKTTNGGDSWTRVFVGFLFTIAIDPANPATLYAGGENGRVFKTTNGGGAWTSGVTTLPAAHVRALALDPASSARVLVGQIQGAGGVFGSADGGATWEASGAGIVALSFGALALDPSDPTIVYTGSGVSGLYKSTDAAGSWQAMSSGITASRNVRAIAVDPVTPTTVYAGTEAGVYKSVDAGSHWTLASNGLSILNVACLVIDPVDPQTLYAGTSNGVFKSTDGAATWSGSSNGLTGQIYDLAIDPQSPATLYAASVGGVGAPLYKTTDGGASWVVRTNGLLPAAYVYGLAIGGDDPQRLYAATDIGVFKTSNGASSWTPTTATSGAASAVAVDPDDANIVYAGTNAAALVRSRDGGNTWLPMGDGLPFVGIWELRVEPGNARVHAATGRGVMTFEPRCGNGIVDPTEACDDGAATGYQGSCCSFPACQALPPASGCAVTSTPTASRTPTPTRTPTATMTATPTPTATGISSPTVTVTSAGTPTVASTPGPSETPTPFAEPTPTPDPAPACGDGRLGADEQCDDGNALGGDGCSSACRYEQLVPGKGSPATDCFAEWAVTNPGNSPYLDRAGVPSIKQRCVDGDPACDADGTVDDVCRFRVAVCLRNADPGLPLCAPAPIARVVLKKPRPGAVKPVPARNAVALLAAFDRFPAATAGRSSADTIVFSPVLAALAPENCSYPFEILVPLVGARSTTTLKLRTESDASSGRTRLDTDTLRLSCERP